MATKAPSKKSQATEVIDHLNKQVANWSVMYMKLHHFHWYVKGPNFFALHAKFEELYDEATLIMDELAERVLTIGGSPVSTLKEHLSLSSIKEATGREKDANAMVQAIIDDYTVLAEECRSGAELAEKAGDEPTADMLIGRTESVEKTIWMLKAVLG